MPPTHHSNRDTILKTIAAVVVLSLAGFAFTRVDEVKTTENTQADTAPTPSAATDDVPATNNTKYRNGTYSSTGFYSSPAGQDNIEISLTLKDDVIVSATFIGHAHNPGSIKYQTLFKEGFNAYVIGKSVNALAFEVVNGSSLTPKGFLDALAKIKAEAQA